jgi:N-succinyldiaminopimelate aminotransferase
MSPVVQAASIAAWRDETHVIENRALYRTKFAQVTPILAEVLDVRLPDAGFYLWAGVPPTWANADYSSDEHFARELLAQYNVTTLPGSYLARASNGLNPGAGRIRMALVAETQECVEAAHRIRDFVHSRV